MRILLVPFGFMSIVLLKIGYIQEYFIYIPYYVKPRAISNYLNLRFGHDEMDGRYGHSNF